MMFADAEDVEAYFVGEFDLVEEVFQTLRRGEEVAPVAGSEIAAAKLSIPICIWMTPVGDGWRRCGCLMLGRRRSVT